MLALFGKTGQYFEILETPPDEVNIGDFLEILEVQSNRSLILQVVDVVYLSIPGELEEIMRLAKAQEIVVENSSDTLIEQFDDEIISSKILKCKVRGALINGGFFRNTLWVPSRQKTIVKKISTKEIKSIMSNENKIPFSVGELINEPEGNIVIDLTKFDGSLNIILGKKGAGKSMLAKTLIKALVNNGAKCFVIDINNEYSVGYSSKVFISLVPGKNLKFSFHSISKPIFISILQNLFNLPQSSIMEISRIWDRLKESGHLSFKLLKKEIAFAQINDYIRDALIRRLELLDSSGIITDDLPEKTFIDEFKSPEGKCISLMLRGQSSIFRKLIIQLSMNQLLESLENGSLEPIFLFAEEAHLYQDMSFWEDLVTRMRHLGLSLFFITNEPESLSKFIYRQSDSIFIFNYINDNDIAFLSKVTDLDSDSLSAFVSNLPERCCLITGKITNNIPLLIKTESLNDFKGGFTRLFFKKEYLKF
ncbi:MAG: ATP-binding protein [Thermoproteota archaeon]|nr:ATP-binding protein [Candidatus Brockarchaeota archaeon]MBO3768397.1 ATP-binding protein [Candidatus Brockarchaeota archaeon]MBO3801518.1 ATP-binding protein [Candidatus Brockarchaeota archaeon]